MLQIYFSFKLKLQTQMLPEFLVHPKATSCSDLRWEIYPKNMTDITQKQCHLDMCPHMCPTVSTSQKTHENSRSAPFCCGWNLTFCKLPASQLSGEWGDLRVLISADKTDGTPKLILLESYLCLEGLWSPVSHPCTSHPHSGCRVCVCVHFCICWHNVVPCRPKPASCAAFSSPRPLDWFLGGFLFNFSFAWGAASASVWSWI